jgi:hypothetical protein
MCNLRILLLLISFLSVAFPTSRANAAGDPESELIGLWVARLSGVSDVHIFSILDIEQKSEGTLLLNTKFGRLNSERESIQAKIVQTSGNRKLVFTTGPGTQVEATQRPDGMFVGTLKPKGGIAAGIALRKLSAEEYERLERSAPTATPKIELPSADVPASCASFVGGWTGVMTTYGRYWLWVVKVTGPNCVATYSYSSSTDIPQTFKTGEIRNSVLTNPTPNGDLTFEVEGGSINVRFSRNHVFMMQKVNISDDSLAKLRAEQGAGLPVTILPGANVPASCAAFFGRWVGSWFRGDNSAEQQLIVHSVNADCVADYSYTASTTRSRTFHKAQIVNGVLSFPCSLSRCTFRLSGETLDAEADQPGTKTNLSVFKKVK